MVSIRRIIGMILSLILSVVSVFALSLFDSPRILASNEPAKAAVVSRSTSTFVGLLQPSEGYEDIEDVDSYDERYDFVFGKIYYLYSVVNRWDDSTGDWSIEGLRFARYGSNNIANAYLSTTPYSPVSWATWSPSSGYYYSIERSNMGVAADCLDYDKFSVGNTVFYHSANSADYIMTELVATTAGPYTFTLSVSDLISWIRPYVASYVGISTNGYSEGYSDGRSVGDKEGYDRGYDVGYDAGINETGPATTIMSLFGAIVSVPIDILNGLSPLVIWNVPIISILMTFLVIGLIIFIVKRFI